MGLALGAAVLGVALLASACGGSSSSSGGTPQQGGTATYAESPGAQPTWIFPFIDAPDNSVYNVEGFEYLMYRPLYWSTTGSDSPNIDFSKSLAGPPTYSGNTVVVNLKNYQWSNGEKVDATSVMFFMNMLLAEKNNYSQYVPGEFPDNVTSVKATGPEQVTFTLNGTYSSTWFTGNQLFQITPMPEAWDKTSDSAAAGSGGCATDVSKCAAVYNYLVAKNKEESSYATDPLWQVVDGPWKLKSFTNEGAVDFVPNPKYSGPDKPKLDQFNEVPFTTPEAEYNAIRAGKTINVGEVPSADLPKRNASSSDLLPPTNPVKSNYNLITAPVWGWSYGIINYGNPQYGATFKQLYIREALQETIDQVTDSDVADRGYAVPSTGPVPNQPATQYLADNQKANNGQGPYPFNIANAKKLLTNHGWTEQGGVMTCTSAGTADNQCGAGVAAGTKLSLKLEYENGSVAAGEEIQQWKSDASQAGIQLNLNSQPFNTVISDTTTCPSNPSTCGWQVAYFGYETFDAVPTGDGFFLPNSQINASGVNDPKMTGLVNSTLHDASNSTFLNYENYAAQQLPGAFNMPDGYKVYAVSSDMGGVSINVIGGFTPEDWYFTK
jgi:peptide/nickel transport system substrate-binding protein